MIGRLLLLAALIALLAVLVEWRLLGRDAAPPIVEAARPGYYLTGIGLEEFGADGRLRLGLQAATAAEEPVSGVVTLQEVVVDYHVLAGQSWRLTAAQGHVPRGAHTVEFEGDVRLSGNPGGARELTELRTARLTLDTAKEHAETREAVTLAFGQHLMHARGLHADLKAGSLQLESDVHGIFTP